jgi:hypothetical protein
MKVASVTSKGQIVDVIGPTVLLSENVFDMVREWAVLLAKPAVFAPIVRTPADNASDAGIYHTG